MPARSKSRFQLLRGCGVVALLLLGARVVSGVEGASGAEAAATSKRVDVYETNVTVRSEVECHKYEGKVLYCTVNPLRAVRGVLETRLILGYPALSIEGDSYETEPQAEGEVKFYPGGDRYRKDYSGERELTLAVVHVN